MKPYESGWRLEGDEPRMTGIGEQITHAEAAQRHSELEGVATALLETIMEANRSGYTGDRAGYFAAAQSLSVVRSIQQQLEAHPDFERQVNKLSQA